MRIEIGGAMKYHVQSFPLKMAGKIGTHVGEKRPGFGVHALDALHGQQGAAAQHDKKAKASHAEQGHREAALSLAQKTAARAG